MPTPELKTWYDFSDCGGVVRAAEKCNGSGDCRKSSVIGGTMCPSYMATGDERLTTRARANIMREMLYAEQENPWDSPEIYDILDLCLACKGCRSECPVRGRHGQAEVGVPAALQRCAPAITAYSPDSLTTKYLQSLFSYSGDIQLLCHQQDSPH
ncbi:MAG: (Fe-S)-binding protein [Marinilabiliales bacterium]|nr:(Fe-S)-binding protein [Marinilabiliales bacterium]